MKWLRGGPGERISGGGTGDIPLVGIGGPILGLSLARSFLSRSRCDSSIFLCCSNPKFFLRKNAVCNKEHMFDWKSKVCASTVGPSNPGTPSFFSIVCCTHIRFRNSQA